MSQIRLSEEDFNSVKDAQEDGDNSSKIAKDLALRLPAVNVAMKCSDFDTYESKWDENLKGFTEEEPSEEIPNIEKDTKNQNQSLSLAEPKERGYFRNTIQTRDPGFDETVDSLGLSIRGAWKMIALLTQRRMELERQIVAMEKYIREGLSFIENDIEK